MKCIFMEQLCLSRDQYNSDEAHVCKKENFIREFGDSSIHYYKQ